jgi:hypothetical protein
MHGWVRRLRTAQSLRPVSGSGNRRARLGIESPGEASSSRPHAPGAALLLLFWLLFPICSVEGPGDRLRPVALAQAAAADPAAAGEFVQGDSWALIVGINAYPNLPPQRQLEAARPGAEEMARVLRQYGVERERIATLYDGGATRARVVEQLQGTLRRDVAPNDSVILYFAGRCHLDPTTKEAWWLPADAVETNPASFLSHTDLQLLLASVPARHLLVVADSCVEEGLVGTSRIFGDPTVRDAYQKRSRWLLASGAAAPRPRDGGPPAPSAFSQTLVSILRDQQLLYVTPLHLAQELEERLPAAEKRSLTSGPMVGLGDDDGQFVFRLEGATPPAAEIRVPAKEEPRIARLRQHMETGRSLNLPQALKEQVLADLQGQVDNLQKETRERRRQQEEGRLKRLEERRKGPGR